MANGLPEIRRNAVRIYRRPYEARERDTRKSTEHGQPENTRALHLTGDYIHREVERGSTDNAPSDPEANRSCMHSAEDRNIYPSPGQQSLQSTGSYQEYNLFREAPLQSLCSSRVDRTKSVHVTSGFESTSLETERLVRSPDTPKIGDAESLPSHRERSKKRSHPDGSTTSNPQSRKRQKRRGNDREELRDEAQALEGIREEQKDSLETEAAQPRLFACPYYKRDPIKHLQCFKRFQLKRVKDVKQHLNRKHAAHEWYCPTCLLRFHSPNDRDHHIVQRSCSMQDRPAQEDDAMTTEQQRAVAKRTDPRLSEPQQWYCLFTTLFPGEPIPKSPYLGTEFEEIIDLVRRYWRENRRDIVTSVIRSHRCRQVSSLEANDPTENVAGSAKEIHKLSAEVFADAMDILLRELDEKTSREGTLSRPHYEAIINIPLHAPDAGPMSSKTPQDTLVPTRGTRHDGDPYQRVEVQLSEVTDGSEGPADGQSRALNFTATDAGLGLAELEVDPDLYFYSGGSTFFTDTNLAEDIVDLHSDLDR